MTEKDKMAIAAIVDFFDSVPQSVQDRLELEQWARENVEEASHIIGKYAREKQRQEEIYIRERNRETELILAEDYLTPDQKLRLVVALHPDGRSEDGKSNPYGVTLADDYFAEMLIYHVETWAEDRDIALTILNSAFDFVRNDPDADPWLMQSVNEYDDYLRKVQEKWEWEKEREQRNIP